MTQFSSSTHKRIERYGIKKSSKWKSAGSVLIGVLALSTTLLN